MIDIANCPPEVQALKDHADKLYTLAMRPDVSYSLENRACQVVACAYGVVANWTNPPVRQGRPVPPPAMDAVKRADYDVCDMLRQIGE